MRILSINYCNGLQQTKINKSKKRNPYKQEMKAFDNDVNFKGKKWAALQSATWAGLGIIAAGPIGGVVGAAIGAVIGSNLDDDEPNNDN